MHDCEPYLERLNDTCVVVLTDYNKAMHENSIASQELYHMRGKIEEKKFKITKLEKDLLLEKDASLLIETQLEIALNQQDFSRNEILCLNRLIQKLFNES